MEQRSVLLEGIARVLNAGGSALLDIYDAATSITTGLLPGEKGKLKAQLREYEKKIERLYYEIGKEVALREYSAQTSAAAEAGIKLVAEYRVKIERIQKCIREIEEKEKAAAAAKKEAAHVRVAIRVKTAPEPSSQPMAGAEESPMTELPEDIPLSMAAATDETNAVTGEVAAAPAPEMAADAPEPAEPEAVAAPAVAATEEITDILAEAETPGQKLQEETAKSGAPVAGESSPGAETKQEAVPEVLEKMLKGELLKLCKDRGIDADQRMTKAAIIGLIKKGRI